MLKNKFAEANRIFSNAHLVIVGYLLPNTSSHWWFLTFI